MLELLMEDMNLVEEKKNNLRNLPLEKKWMVVQQQLGQRYRDPQPADCMDDIEMLRSSPLDTAFLTNLAVALRSKPISWVNAFIENEGLAVLLENLKKVEEGERCF